jgi:hypothetical protein
MDDAPVEFQWQGMLVSTDRTRLDPDAILALLRTTFWAKDMTRKALVRAIANSVNFGLFDAAVLVGFGRAVTDLSTLRVLDGRGHRRRASGPGPGPLALRVHAGPPWSPGTPESDVADPGRRAALRAGGIQCRGRRAGVHGAPPLTRSRLGGW